MTSRGVTDVGLNKISCFEMKNNLA